MITSFAMWMMLRRMNGWWGSGDSASSIVVVLVLDLVGRRLPNGPTVQPSATPSKSLEGSRFAMHLTTSRCLFQRFTWEKNVATGGSRESPTDLQLYRQAQTKSQGAG